MCLDLVTTSLRDILSGVRVYFEDPGKISGDVLFKLRFYVLSPGFGVFAVEPDGSFAGILAPLILTRLEVLPARPLQIPESGSLPF